MGPVFSRRSQEKIVWRTARQPVRCTSDHSLKNQQEMYNNYFNSVDTHINIGFGNNFFPNSNFLKFHEDCRKKRFQLAPDSSTELKNKVMFFRQFTLRFNDLIRLASVFFASHGSIMPHTSCQNDFIQTCKETMIFFSTGLN